MNIFEKALNAVGLQLKGAGIPLVSGISDNFIIWANSKKVPADRALETYNGWVYACIRAIAEEIAKIEHRLLQIKGEDHVEVYDHELLDLLNGVNPHTTGYELKYLTAAHLELAGNAFWLLVGKDGEPVKSDSEKPASIYILNPKYVKIIKAPAPEFIKGYRYKVDSEEREYKSHQILHFKYPDPNDPYEGIGTVQAIAPWIDADNFATQVNAKYFRNGARLGGFLKSDATLSDVQMKVLRAQFESLYKGADNAYRVAILPKGISYDEASANPKDMDFANMMTTMRDKILAGFRVPKTILGGSESETNRATAETANYIFAARTIKPKMEQITQTLNEFLVTRFGDNIYLDFTDPVPEDKEAKIREMTAAVGQQPIISVNEAREQFLSLGPINNGDAVMTDYTKIPLGEPEKAKKVNRSSKKKLTGDQRKSTRYSRSAKARKSMSEEIADSILKGVKIQEKAETEIREKIQKDATGIEALTDDQYEVIYKAFETRVTPFEKKIIDALKGFNQKQREAVIKKLSSIAKSYGKKAIDPKDLYDQEEWLNILVNLTSPIYTDLFSTEGAAAGKLIGWDFVLTDDMKAAIKRAVELMSDSYNETTRQLLADTLNEGLAAGDSISGLTDRISNIYEFSDEKRAATVARTEAFRTANDANREAWKQSGVVNKLKWYTAKDERVCEFCGPMHNKTVAIDETFFDKGETIEGNEGGSLPVDYSKIENPPLHPNCRCYVRPEEITIE